MIGETIGHFRITRQLGAGGMGVVYAAEHVKMGIPAAIKVLLPEYSSNPQIVTRFFNEARAAGTINDPGLVRVTDFGQHTDGSAYIVMELLQGESLAARLRREKRIGVTLTCGLARQLAGTLAAVHERGIVHRDLKPDNIYLVPDRDVALGLRAKILDFGIAKLTDPTMGPSQTRTSAVMGTPPYMAPEQCRSAGQVDARSDIYSLGCVLFEMLVGRPPFRGEAVEIMSAHLNSPPPLLREIDPSIPGEIDTLVQAMLAKDPAARPPNMMRVVVLVESVPLSGRPASVLQGASESMPTLVPQRAVGTIPTGKSDPGRPQTHTTLGGATGQSEPGLARSRAKLFVPLLLGVGALVAGIAIVSSHHSSSKQAAAAPAPPVVSSAAPAPPAPGSLDITTTPPGAEVTVDGSDLGPSPQHLRGVAPGKHAITIAPAGTFRAARRELELEPGKSAKIDVPLEGIHGTAKLTSPVAGTTVTLVVDGEKHPLGAAPQVADVDMGHKMEALFEAPGHDPVTKPVAIATEGQEITIDGAPTASSTPIVVHADPDGALILVDGKLVGHGSARAPVGPGSHTVTVRCRYYFEKELGAKGGDSLNVTLKLQPGGNVGLPCD